MQRAMAPLKRQMSPRLEESEGSQLWVQFPAPHPLTSPPALQPLGLQAFPPPPLRQAALYWRKGQVTAPAQRGSDDQPS